MNTKDIIIEHSELSLKIEKLNAFIYNNGGLNPLTNINNNKTQDDLVRNMVTYGNYCMQLMSMKNYLKALECRLNNEGIFFENGEYLERVGKIVRTPVHESKEENHNEE